MPTIGIIGVGYFGKNYLKVLDSFDDVQVKWVCSRTKETIKECFNSVKPKKISITTRNYKKVLKDKEVDAVAIVTPASTHYKIAKEALNAEKHVIVEKPFVLNLKHAKELAKLAKKKKKMLMVGHIHRFNPGITKIKEDIKKGKFGKITAIHFEHLGNIERKNVSALWDFLPHSCSIFLDILGMPKKVKVSGDDEKILFDFSFSSSIATGIASFEPKNKKTEITIAGEKLQATYNDNKKTLIYFKTKPKKQELENKMPLTEELRYFVDSLKTNRLKINDADDATKIVKIIEAAEKSLKTGKEVII